MLYFETVSAIMHDVSTRNIRQLFIHSSDVHTHNTRSSSTTKFYIQCSVVTSVNHTSTRSERNSHSPCSRCEHGVNKSELSFDFRWFNLNDTTPHLATRIHGEHPVREFKSQRADKAIKVPKRGQRNFKSQSADKTVLTNIRQHGGFAPDFPGFPSASRRQCGPKVEEM